MRTGITTNAPPKLEKAKAIDEGRFGGKLQEVGGKLLEKGTELDAQYTGGKVGETVVGVAGEFQSRKEQAGGS